MEESPTVNFHKSLRQELDKYVHLVYKITKTFPKEELYGVTSQLRRATLSVMLNYIEGYARMKSKVHKNFIEISYGSLKESKYLLHFSLKEEYINKNDYQDIINLAEHIGAMLYGIIKNLK